jgi:enolase
VTGAHIVTVFAWEGLDSRGRPTVACSMKLADGTCVATAVPAGASRGRHEAVELRDGDERYGGFGVRRAVAAVKDVTAPAVLGFDVRDQRGLDSLVRELDGTPRLQRLGANAVLAVSITAALAAAATTASRSFGVCSKATR